MVKLVGANWGFMAGLVRSSLGVFALVAWLLSGCSSTSLNRAPVEDRGTSASAKPVVVNEASPATNSAPTSTPLPAVVAAPGSENAGKPGYYTVKRKDTLIAIGLETGQHPKDIARWNNIDKPDRIEVGQVLRVVPPTAPAGDTAVATRPVTSSTVVGAPIAAGTAKPTAASTPAVAAASAPATTPRPSAVVTEDDIAWIWPAKGGVVAGFDEVKNKGLDLSGAAGDPVWAAADGKVVYAGAGLRGYGNLIILKHNNTFLTAYAHNQALLVKEDQAVKKGQKIAEMGNSDADRVKLHFEVRRQGKPVDPSKYLPAR